MGRHSLGINGGNSQTQIPYGKNFKVLYSIEANPNPSLLLSLKQTGTVEEYPEQLELYAGPLKCSEPSYLEGIFLNGLKDVIRAE